MVAQKASLNLKGATTPHPRCRPRLSALGAHNMTAWRQFESSPAELGGNELLALGFPSHIANNSLKSGAPDKQHAKRC
jgi:hypothetical protein